MIGDAFTLICSVMVDFNTIVDLTWTTPNPRAIAEHRLSQPESSYRNLSWPGTHLKLVEQVINITICAQWNFSWIFVSRGKHVASK